MPRPLYEGTSDDLYQNKTKRDPKGGVAHFNVSMLVLQQLALCVVQIQYLLP